MISLFSKLTFEFITIFSSALNGGYPLSPNKECRWQNLLGCDHWALSGSPEPTMIGFCDLVGVGIGPVPKKLADKWSTNLYEFRASTIIAFQQRNVKDFLQSQNEYMKKESEKTKH